MSPSATPQELIALRLAEYLGPNTARVAARLCSERATGRAAGPLTRAEETRLLEALRPMLRTLLGRARAEDLLRQLAQDLA
ncbi:MAG TPA: hypothetical protein VFG53_02680 [Anaeromyxobacter sp.]|nr:hypothetical protein [Anaeromyxobacter sp.]